MLPRIQDDFYRYVNQEWLENNPIPSKYTRWGTFENLHYQNQLKLRDLIENKSNGEFSNISNLYNEYMNEKKNK